MRGAHLYCGLSSGKHGKYAVASLRNRAGILQNTPAYLVRLGIGFACLLLSGWSGGHMVYELNVGILPK